MLIFNLPITIQNLFFIAKVGIGRIKIRMSNNSHPDSSPFITGDGFRTMATHIYDTESTIDPLAVQKNDIVFVALPLIREYLESVHRRIKNPYILISHNGDTCIDESFRRYIDKKIVRWWTQNLMIKHPKLFAIPIGIENLSYYNHGIPELFAKRHSGKRKNRVLFGFSVSTNPAVRGPIQTLLQKISTCDEITERLNSKQYIEKLREYQFVASPPGNGEDCIRTWEAMYVGTIPIVLKSTMVDFFSDTKFPMWVVDNYTELENMTESRLRKKFDAVMKNSTNEALYLPYWEHRIRSTYD